MLQYIGYHGIVIQQQHHTNISPITAVLFTESADTGFDPSFRINVNGDKPIPVTAAFEMMQQIVGDYEPRKGGGLDAEDIKDILSKLEWTGHAYIYDKADSNGVPRLLLTSHALLVENDPLWCEIATYKLKEHLNMFHTEKAEPVLWK